MNPKVFALAEDMTAGESITALQRSRDVEVVFYLYVIDARRHLVGVVSLRRLLLVSPDTPLKRIMTTDLISVRADMDQEEVARQVASYNLLAIPVVDEENKLVGVITVDDVIDVIKDEATEDVYRLAGVAGDDRVFTKASESLRKRLPWLLVNLATAFLAASVVALFTKTIDAVVALAVFMPVVAGMGGNAATQTLTVIVRGIALGELTWGNSRKALFKEAAVGIGNGVACGLVGGLVVWLFNGDTVLAAHPGDGDDHQHVRRGDGRHHHSPGAAGDESRSGAGVGGVHYDAHRHVWLLFVPRAGDGVHQVSAPPGGRMRTLLQLIGHARYTSEALILRTYKLGEADRIVVFLTRDRGKKRGVAKGARRARSRFIGALEPMTRAGVAYYEREQRDLVRINYVEPQRSPLRRRAGEALGHVGYFAELIDEWAPEAHADERLYRLGSAMIDAFAGGAPIEPLARYFEYLAPAAAGRLSVADGVPGVRRAARRRRGDAAARRSVVCRRCAPAGGTSAQSWRRCGS